jgi:hypothetical protein
MARTSLLCVGYVPRALALQSAVGGSVHFANTPLGAARALVESRPTAIILSADATWARDLIASLSPAECPAVLAVGAQARAAVGLADGWLPVDWDVPEAQEVLNRALAKARFRRFAPSGLPDRVEVPGRRALLRALLRGGEHACRQSTALSALVFKVDESGELQRRGGSHWRHRVGRILQGRIRRSETCGHLMGSLFGVVLQGGHRSALGALARLDRLLAKEGMPATFDAFEVDLRRPLHDLRWRASRLRGTDPRCDFGAWREAPA